MDPDQEIEDYNENADDAVEASEHVEAGGTGDAGDAGGNGDAGGTGDAGDTGGNGEDGEDGESGDDDSQLETFEDEDILMEPSHWLGPSTTNWKRVYTGHGTDEISLIKGRLWDALEAENQAEAKTFTQRLGHLRARTVVRIDYDDALGPLLQTSVSGELVPADAQALRRAFWRYPAMTWGVIARIHWQALKLAARRLRFFSKPPRPTEFVTR